MEAALRNCDGKLVTEDDVSAIAGWQARNPGDREVPFQPARVVLQDFTGVPAVVDLAAMRNAVKRLGGDPERINPAVPVDLVIDHSVQVDVFGTAEAYQKNAEIEFQRNRSAMSSCAGAEKSSTAFGSYRPPPVSCTRSTSSTWPKLSIAASRVESSGCSRTRWWARIPTPR